MSAIKILAAGTGSVAQAVAASICGATLGVVTATGERAVEVVGLAQREPDIAPPHRSTWFDLAPLTKVLFTAPTLLELVVQEDMALDDKPVVVMPDLRQYDSQVAERQLTFCQYLSHQPHLPAVEPLHTHGLERATLRALMLQRAWRHRPPVYSNINFMLLGIAIERVTGCLLGELRPSAGLACRPALAETVATGCCAWRGRVMRGEMHDDNAFALGGAAGHAGLSGTIDGVLDAAQRLLQAVDRTGWRTRQSATQCLGREAKHKGWSGGNSCSEECIDHTGFTGTGVRIDFRCGLSPAPLTNREHTICRDTDIDALRRRAGDLIVAGAS